MKLPEQFTTVTPFSKALALSLFILLPLLTFFLGIEYQKRTAMRPPITEVDPGIHVPLPTATVTPSAAATPITSDVDNTFTGNMPLRYSFKHLEGYTVVHASGYNYRIVKAGVSEDSTVQDPKTRENDPEALDLTFVNYYQDTVAKPGTVIEQKDVENWMKTSGLTAAQCAVNRKVSSVPVGTAVLYKVDIICDYGASSAMYLLEADKSRGDFVLLSGNMSSKQFSLFVNTFTVIK